MSHKPFRQALLCSKSVLSTCFSHNHSTGFRFCHSYVPIHQALFYHATIRLTKHNSTKVYCVAELCKLQYRWKEYVFRFLLVSDIKYCAAKLEAKAKPPLTHQPQFNFLSRNFLSITEFLQHSFSK